MYRVHTARQSMDESRSKRDAFQTYGWKKALPVPDLAAKQIGQILALR
jgi:hypothetical protein